MSRIRAERREINFTVEDVKVGSSRLARLTAKRRLSGGLDAVRRAFGPQILQRSGGSAERRFSVGICGRCRNERALHFFWT